MDDSESYFIDSTDTAKYGGKQFKCDFNETQKKHGNHTKTDSLATERVIFCPLKYVKNIKQNEELQINGVVYFVNYSLKTLKYFSKIYVRLDKDDEPSSYKRYDSQSFKRQPRAENKNL